MPGANRSDAAIDVFTDGRVRLRFGGTDAGTGQKTILRQIVAEELGVDIEQVDVLSTESDKTPFDMGAWSSRGTHYSGHAARMTALETAKRLKTLAVQRLGDGDVRLEGGLAINGARSMPLGDVVKLSNEVADDALTTECSYIEETVQLPNPSGVGNNSASYNYAAHGVLVSVDSRTGQLRILDYVAAHDVGTAINPQFVEGQICGGAAMGLGAAMGEELLYQTGKLVNPSYLNYPLPRAADLPRIRAVLVDSSDPRGPYGAKAVGEATMHPPGPALANAVYDAIGVRIRDLPITPDKILTALAAQRGAKRRFNIWRRPRRWWIALVRWAYFKGLFGVLHRRSLRLAGRAKPRRPESVAKPADLQQALNSLGPDSMAVAGGTDLQPQVRSGLAAPKQLVSLLSLPEMQDAVRETDGTLAVGASVTLADFDREWRQWFPELSDLVEQVATPQIRAMATVGGNLIQTKRCWFYRSDFPCYKRKGGLSPCYAITGDHRFYHNAIDGHRCQAVTPSDLAAAFVALDATAVITGPEGTRHLPMSSFYTGPGETVLGDSDLLIQVRIPLPSARRRMAYEKLRLWQGDFAIVSLLVAADIDVEGRWSNVRIVFGGLASKPWRASQTERRLEGLKVSTAQIRAELDRELNSVAHPLRNNAWKLDAAVGLAENVTDRLLGAGHSSAN
jgi:CO/xanthine dehydrogenase FAD-binding subunit